MPLNNKIQLRRGTSADWASIGDGDGPVLASGEPGFEIDANILKIGDGSTTWKDLKPIGSDQNLYKVKNTSGGIIYKGQAVRANGTVGNSDAIQVTTFIADGSVPEYTLMGLATQDMNNNDFGYVTAFGQIQKLDTDPDNLSTNICSAGENWIDGDILYASPTASGKLTKNKPQHDTIIAIILNAADDGSLFVRPSWNPHINDIHDVIINNPQNNDALIYNSSSGIWTNSPISGGENIGGSANQVIFKDSTNTATGNANFTFNETGTILNIDNLRIDDNTLSSTNNNGNILISPTGTGKVGINTSSPQQSLHIAGDQRIENVIDPKLEFHDTAAVGAYVKFDTSADNLVLSHIDVTGDNQLVLTNGSGVGVGTSLPNATLHAYTPVSGATVFNVEGTNGSLFSVVDNLSGVLMSVNNNAGLPVFEVYDDDSIIGGRFAQNDFVISSSGNVGIGTDSPITKLDVSGVITATGGNSTEWNEAYDWIQASGSSGGGIAGSGSAGQIAFWTDSTTISNDADLVWDSGTNRLGVGISAPSGTLHVVGDTYVDDLNINSRYTEKVIPINIVSSGLTIPLDSGNLFTTDLDSGITSITISGVPSTSGVAMGFSLVFTADGTARSVTWPSGVKWANASAPTLTSASGKIDAFSFFSIDQGSTWLGFIGGQNY